jgi:hypothetical protein
MSSVIRAVYELLIFTIIRNSTIYAEFVSIVTRSIRTEIYDFFHYFTKTFRDYYVQGFHSMTQCKPGGSTELVWIWPLVQARSQHHSLKPQRIICGNCGQFVACPLCCFLFGD